MRHQRGNVLFLILLAIILFAALSYAVSSSINGNGNDATEEELKSQIALLQNAQLQSRSALQRMMMIGRYLDWQIIYNRTGLTVSGITNATCTGSACDLHDPLGGGIKSYILPSKYWESVSTCANTATIAGKPRYMSTGVVGIGINGNRELLIQYPCVSKALCMAFNNAYGVTNPGGEPPLDKAADNGGTTSTYNGTMTSSSIPLASLDEYGINEPSVAGKQAFCTATQDAPTIGMYSIWMVLLER